MQIPLPKGLVGDKDIPRLQEELVNLFNPGNNTLLKTPGVSSFATGIGPCRGSITFNEEDYQVSGQQLIRVPEAGSVVLLGTIEGTADVVMATSFIALEIVVKGGKGYSFSLSGGLVEITDSNFITSVDVSSINQRFVFTPADGGPIFYTDVNTPTVIDPRNFFDAELLPDKNKGTINLRNDLYVGGRDSFEVFRDTIDISGSFTRVDGAAVDTGYLSAKVRYKDTFLFLGRDRETSYGFFAMSAGSAPRVSNEVVDEILNNEYTVKELSECTSIRFTIKNIDMVCFRLARHSLLFYGTGWSYMQTGVDGLGVVSPWDVKFASFAYGQYITGNASNNAIGILDNGILEFGEEIERVIQTFIRTDSNQQFIINNIFLNCTTGSSLVAGSIALQVSLDNLTYGPQVPRSLSAKGKKHQQVVWYGGAGQFERYAGLRLRTTSDVDFACDGLEVNV